MTLTDLHLCVGYMWCPRRSACFPPCSVCGGCLKACHILSTCSDVCVVPTGMMPECCFAAVTHMKCHFIWGYLIAQSLICSWLHLFVVCLKWMYVQDYIKNHLSLGAGIRRQATECTFLGYFLFCGALFQHFFLLKEGRVCVFLHRATVWVQLSSLLNKSSI